jgi:4-diphosphocytidyl-2-C-methyl-D-erythritol kinase
MKVMLSPDAITSPAPAKINLHLHITGKREDGYHLLDSLVCFADIHDTLTATPSHDGLSFTCDGPFASDFSDQDTLSSRDSSNLIVRAAWLLADHLGRHPDVVLHLTKNLPLGSGVGGGSSDAAAALRSLAHLWNASLTKETLHHLAGHLGSDVPVCLDPHAVVMRATGNELFPAPQMPLLPALLVNPGIACPTPDVYKALRLLRFSEPVSFPDAFLSPETLALFLKDHSRNDMTEAAVQIAPVIADVLKDVGALPDCLLARLSGSGATVFGLFRSPAASQKAAAALAEKRPDWWIRPASLNY